MSLSIKDPEEIVTVTVDFTGLATSVANPVITCSVFSGQSDPSSQDMVSGSPQVSGLNVLQRIAGGLDGNTYKLRCRVDDADGERWILSDVLTVRSA